MTKGKHHDLLPGDWYTEIVEDLGVELRRYKVTIVTYGPMRDGRECVWLQSGEDLRARPYTSTPKGIKHAGEHRVSMLHAVGIEGLT